MERRIPEMGIRFLTLRRKIYIGIDDDLTVVGVDNSISSWRIFPNKIINNTGVFPETNHIKVDGKDVIEIVIEPCGMPISYRGAYYYRSGLRNKSCGKCPPSVSIEEDGVELGGYSL